MGLELSLLRIITHLRLSSARLHLKRILYYCYCNAIGKAAVGVFRFIKIIIL